eukprot:COSAG01_NODE_43_length_32320_cov_622.744763_31_plen_56_part_00
MRQAKSHLEIVQAVIIVRLSPMRTFHLMVRRAAVVSLGNSQMLNSQAVITVLLAK